MNQAQDRPAPTSAQQRIDEFHSAWVRKPVLRHIYGDYYQRIMRALSPGPTLEIGSGPGNLKASLPDVVSTDITYSPWTDIVADAQRLPFADQSFANIVAVDVLHHLPHPVCFFHEASRVLAAGGKVVLLEPAITPISWVFYRWCHPELVDMRVDPLRPDQLSSDQPFDANQAIPSLLFGKYLDSFQAKFPSFVLANKQYLSLFAYPLSGGFRPWSLIPKKLVAPLLRIEDWVNPVFGKLCAFRLFVVLVNRRVTAKGNAYINEGC